MERLSLDCGLYRAYIECTYCYAKGPLAASKSPAIRVSGSRTFINACFVEVNLKHHDNDQGLQKIFLSKYLLHL